MNGTMKKFLQGIVDAEQAAAIEELRQRLPTLRAEVLERLENLDGIEPNLPTATDDHVSDAVLRVARNEQEKRGGSRREDAIDFVLGELAREFA